MDVRISTVWPMLSEAPAPSTAQASGHPIEGDAPMPGAGWVK